MGLRTCLRYHLGYRIIYVKYVLVIAKQLALSINCNNSNSNSLN